MRLCIGTGVAVDEPVENLIGARVAQSEVALVGLALDEVGRRGLAYNFFRDTQVARERPYLRLEEIA